LLFQPVYECPQDDGSIPAWFGTTFIDCTDYRESVVNYMRERSFTVASYWTGVLVACLVGNMLTVWAFGTASERLNKRVRDSSFLALLRQEVAYFDKRSVGSITSKLQDDAGRLHAFSGAPLRSFIVAVSSVVTGIIISFIFMWPFALVAIACVPIMGVASAFEMKKMMGEDHNDEDASDELNSPGGIVVETLLNIRTVSALGLEYQRLQDYQAALFNSEQNYRFAALMSGITAGLSFGIQQWINALQLWFGGYLLFTFPDTYTFNDFLIANFSVLFGLFGLGAAFQDMADRKEVEKSAGRIFYLLDRKSENDPLSKDGRKLD
jgi:ATP-binding cassette subfamily B (MDR/TAP) protein 1